LGELFTLPLTTMENQINNNVNVWCGKLYILIDRLCEYCEIIAQLQELPSLVRFGYKNLSKFAREHIESVLCGRGAANASSI
jgi:hypothetical protein